MAAPIIDSVVVVPPTIQPGGTAVVTVTAHDPDSRVGELTGQVADSQGNLSEATALLTISDLLAYGLSTDEEGWAIVQRPAPQDHIFDVTAPP